MGDKVDPPDAEIARIADAQHGVLTVGQLLDAGISRDTISARVRRGQLHRLHQGVYAVGHGALSREGHWMAAVRACGSGAVLSHGAAAELWGLLRPADGPIDVSVPTRGGRARRDGIRVHRCPSLATASLERSPGAEPIPASTLRRGIPVTAPWRTIDDLRRAAEDRRDPFEPKPYRRAVREAELRRLALSPRTPRDRTRSDLERHFLALCRRHGLPPPEVNVRIGRWTVDFLWRSARLVVETDSWSTHGGSIAFEDDHERDLDLRRRGYAVHRYADPQLAGAAEAIAAELREHLAKAAGLDV